MDFSTVTIILGAGVMAKLHLHKNALTTIFIEDLCYGHHDDKYK